MKIMVKNMFFFSTPLFIGILIEGGYKVFILGLVDSKFSGDYWLAFQVWIGLGLILFCFLSITFFILSFLSGRLTKLNLSIGQSFVMGISVSILTYIYGLIRSRIFNSIYDPVDVGNIVLIAEFIGLNILAKMKSQLFKNEE